MACKTLRAPACLPFLALLAPLRLSRLNCLRTSRVLRLAFRALPCGVLPSMPLIVWHAKPGVFPPFSPSSDFCLSEANSCRRAVWTGLGVAPCGQASAWLLSGPCIPCGVVARERIQSLTGPQRGLSGSTVWSDSLRWQGPVPGLEHQDSKTRWPYPLRRPIAFPNRSQFSVPN